MFGLEWIQGRHNATKSTMANISGSNDPHQIKNDVINNSDLLISGAGAIASGRNLGFADEEVPSVIASNKRRRQRQQPQITEEEAIKAADAVAPSEVTGVGYSDPNRYDTFGINEDEAVYSPDPNTVRVPVQDPETKEWYQGSVTLAADQPTPGLKGYYQEQQDNLARIRRGKKPFETRFPVVEELLARDAGIYWEAEGKSNNPEVSRFKKGVFGGKRVPIKEKPRRGYYTTRGGATGRDARTESQRFEDNRDAIAAEKQLSADMVAAESARRNPEAEEANLWRAQAEARILAKENAGAGSETLRTGQWQQPAGGWSGEYPIAVQGSDGTWIDAKSQMSLAAESPEGTVNLGSQSGPADRATTVGSYVDPMTGAIMPVQEPATTAISGANTPNTGQMLNAPAPGSAIDWVATQAPDLVQKDRFISSDLGTTARIFSERIGRSPDSPIRNIDELQAAADAYIASRAAQNKPFYERQDDGTRRRNDSPGMEQVLDSLRYTTAEKRALASAMFSTEMARRSDVNTGAKDAFFGAGRVNPAGQAGSGNWDQTARPQIITDAADAMLTNRGWGYTGAQLQNMTGKIGPTDSVAITGQLPHLSGQASDWGTGVVINNRGAEPSIYDINQDQVYNRTGQKDPQKIARQLTDQDRIFEGRIARSGKKDSRTREERQSALMQNIQNAQAVQARAEATARRAQDIELFDAAGLAGASAEISKRAAQERTSRTSRYEKGEPDPNQVIVSSGDRQDTERREGRLAQERRRRMGRPSMIPGSFR